MAKKLVTLLVVLMVMLTVSYGALAQGEGVVWSSAYQIANLESTEATVHIAYYAQDSSDVYEGDVTVPADGSKTIFPFTADPVVGDNIDGPDTFSGSAVLSSDKQIAAILNTQTGAGSSSFYGASTQGFSEGATEVSLPLIACNNGGFNTWFNIQNAGSGDASVTVDYIPGLNGQTFSETVTLGQYQAKTFDQEAGSSAGTADCDDLADASGKFVGGAKVTSDEPIVATVMFLGTGGIKAVQGYNAFTGGAEAINLPLIMANNSSYYTSIQVQNAGASDASVVVNYGPNTVSSGTPISETFTVAGGGSETIIHLGDSFSDNNWDDIGQYVGGATITQDGTSEPLVAVVNQNSTQYTSLGSTYEGMAPAGATTNINLPLVSANNSGYLTGIQVQAVEADTDVTITYAENSQEAGETPTPDTFTLTDAGDSKTLIQSGEPGPLSGVNNWDDIGQYVGAATVTADKPILAIVNFNGPVSGDTFYTYDGFNLE
jgi:hypothetical protein